eukprot:UN34611
MICTGVYPPRVRVYDLHQLSMRFERFFDDEITDFCIFEQDWKKVAFLRSDRYIEFHSQYGLHEKIRVPKFGRSLSYNKFNCEMYIACSEPEVYRLNLNKGQFFSPFKTNISDVLTSSLNNKYHLLGLGGKKCKIEIWDVRDKKRANSLKIDKVTDLDTLAGSTPDVTALEFDNDGLTLGAGLSNGEILFFDIRSRHPLKKLNHRYGLPIKRIKFHESSKKIHSCDAKNSKNMESNRFFFFY